MTRSVYFLATALLLIALPLTGQSSPTISWSGPQNIQIGIGQRPYFLLDIDGDGVTEFTFSRGVDPFFISAFGSSENDLLARVYEGEPTLANTAPLTEGTQIDADPTGDTAWESVWEYGSQTFVTSQVYDDRIGNGAWFGVADGYQGIRFVEGGETYYGWVRMSFPTDLPEAIIHDWAYETRPGFGIMAGVVPEPSTWALFLCGGACLLGRLRFCRKAKRE